MMLTTNSELIGFGEFPNGMANANKPVTFARNVKFLGSNLYDCFFYYITLDGDLYYISNDRDSTHQNQIQPRFIDSDVRQVCSVADAVDSTIETVTHLYYVKNTGELWAFRANVVIRHPSDHLFNNYGEEDGDVTDYVDLYHQKILRIKRHVKSVQATKEYLFVINNEHRLFVYLNCQFDPANYHISQATMSARSC